MYHGLAIPRTSRVACALELPPSRRRGRLYRPVPGLSIRGHRAAFAELPGERLGHERMGARMSGTSVEGRVVARRVTGPPPRVRLPRVAIPANYRRHALAWRRAGRDTTPDGERWKMSFILELWAFMRERKKYWLLPILMVMVLLGGAVVLTQGSAVAPFIYTLF